MSSPAGNAPPLRLMVLAPNWLGDVVMHTPLLSLLHEHRPSVLTATGRPLEIHLGLRGAWVDLFRSDPRIDNLVILDSGARDRGLGGTFRLAKILRRDNYDAVLIAPPSLRTAVAARLARIPVRIGYRTDGRGPLLSHGLKVAPRGSVHYAREMVALGENWLRSLGIAVDSGQGDTVTSSLPGCLSLAPVPLGEGPPVWAVAPGTTYGEAKTWPLTQVADFLDLAVRQAGARVVLLGDMGARVFADHLRERFPGRWSHQISGDAQVMDLIGTTDLPTAVGILKSSAAFVGNDSGLMHLAAGLDLPTVGVFGSSNPRWTAPLGPRTRAVVAEGFSCRPCYRKTCNQPVFCLDTVPAEAVMGSLQECLADDPSRNEVSG